jgi:tRNA (guanine6-N2)-methyltransferase
MSTSKIPPWLRTPRPLGERATYELEVLPGLEPLAADEAHQRAGARAIPTGRPGRLTITSGAAAGDLLALRSVVAVHAVESFDVRHPAALLPPANLARIRAQVERAIALHPSGSFSTLRLSAAGADSMELIRLADEVAEPFGLRQVREAAQLVLAVRRGPEGGWETLVRVSPRPLSARPWRICNLPGALDATAANAMIRLAGLRPGERFLNLASGSGTLLIERLALGPARLAVGVELDPKAVDCARRNLEAAGADGAEMLRADLRALPFADRSFDTVVVDLPFGMLMGGPQANRTLYAAALDGAARALVPGGALVAITAGWRLLDALLADRPRFWQVERALRISIPFRGGYVKPTIYLLRRAPMA